MLKYRQDYLTQDKVLISKKRSQRPYEYIEEYKTTDKRNCPFCVGGKLETETIKYKNDRIIIIPNKYPILDIMSNKDFFGIHEIVIDTPIHDEKLYNFSEQNIAVLIKSILNRVSELKKIKDIKYIQIFKNDGKKAGASIFHSHMQILAINFATDRQLKIADNFENYMKQYNKCYICDIITKLDNLKIIENNSFVAYCPYASTYENMVNIAPKRHFDDISNLNDDEILDFANILKNILHALSKIYIDFNYNMCLQNKIYDKKYNHFYMQIIPRKSSVAGFEISSGCFVNSLEPELASQIIRKKIYEN